MGTHMYMKVDNLPFWVFRHYDGYPECMLQDIAYIIHDYECHASAYGFISCFLKLHGAGMVVRANTFEDPRLVETALDGITGNLYIEATRNVLVDFVYYIDIKRKTVDVYRTEFDPKTEKFYEVPYGSYTFEDLKVYANGEKWCYIPPRKALKLSRITT